MEVAYASALFALGLFILVVGAKYLVRGAVSVSAILKLSPWFVGMVIVGIGTSIPEFAINVAAAFAGSGVGVAAVIGSNTFNILAILGFSALLTPAVLERRWVTRDLVFNVAAVFIAAAFIFYSLDGDGFAGISFFEGAILSLFFIGWMAVTFFSRKGNDEDADQEVFALSTSFFFIVLGLAGVFAGGQWVVAGAETVALSLGISAELVGFTLVAIGTSLPELSVSLVAAWKRHTGIAVGNLIGSNIFDILGIFGITALLHPIAIEGSLRFDIFAVLLASTAAILAAVCVKRCWYISRTEGFFLLLLYAAYLAYLFMR